MLVEHRPEPLLVELGDRRAGDEAADQVEDDVDPTEALGDRVDRRLGGRRLPQVADRRGPAVVGKAGLGRDLGQAVRGPSRPGRAGRRPRRTPGRRPVRARPWRR